MGLVCLPTFTIKIDHMDPMGKILCLFSIPYLLVGVDNSRLKFPGPYHTEVRGRFSTPQHAGAMGICWGR